MLNRSMLLLIALLIGVIGCADIINGPMLPAKYIFLILLVLYFVSVALGIRKIRSNN